jgi:hypothetical protein
VQVLEVFGPRLAGAQLSVVGVTGVIPWVTTPPEDTNTRLSPEAEDAEALLTPIELLDTPGAIVRFTIATVPFERVVEFMPYTRHVYVPEPAWQLKVMPAEVVAEPAVAVTEVISVGA